MAIGSENSAAAILSAWVRRLMPSIADLLFVAMLGLLVFTSLSMRLLGDAGIGWHIRTGQIILATHSVPRVDPFSSSMAGHAWFAWEWLSDVLVGWLEKVAGLNGVVLFTALIIAGVFSWAFRLLVRQGANVLLALLLVLLAASASMIHFLARPHVVSWLFTLLWFWILENSEKRGTTDRESKIRGTRLLWLLPLTMLVWVNVHGGFLVGFVLLKIYWICAFWQWASLAFTVTEGPFDQGLRKIEAGRRVWNLTLAGVLSSAASLANPYGIRLPVHIYHYLSNRFLMNHIEEFQSPNFHYVAQKCFAALLLLTLIALAVKHTRTRASQLLVVLFAVISGLYASRNIPVSSLLLILVVGPWLSSASQKPGRFGHSSKSFLNRMKSIELGLRGHVWPIAAVLLTLWIAGHGGGLGNTRLMNAHFDPKRFPVAAVDYLEKQSVQGPVLSPDIWGGYLIYRLYPHTKVVVDDRHDLYGEEFLKSYLKLVHVEPGWREFLRQHPANYVVVPRESPLAGVLGETREWRRVYVDEVAMVFEPASADD
jgi:hypothetical protein